MNSKLMGVISTKKCSTLCRAGHFIGQVENVWSHTRPFSKEFQPNLFHSQTSIKITFYVFSFFSLKLRQLYTVQIISDCSLLFSSIYGETSQTAMKSKILFHPKSRVLQIAKLPNFLSTIVLFATRVSKSRFGKVEIINQHQFC